MEETTDSRGPVPFGPEWARALQRELEGSEEFRRVAGGWQGRLVLERRLNPQ